MYNPKGIRIYIGGKEVTGFTDGATMLFKAKESPDVNSKPERVRTKEVEVYYSVIGAGPVGHPEVIFRKICQQQLWDVIEATPLSIGDCWIFKVQMYNDSLNAYLPSYIEILEEYLNG